MAEYIEREALLKQALKEKRFVFRMEDLLNHEVVFQTVYKDFGEFVCSIPAADVVEVVRCKDCKHYHHYGRTSLLIDGKNIKSGWCQRRIRYDEEHRMLADDFCSYGKRRADNCGADMGEVREYG